MEAWEVNVRFWLGKNGLTHQRSLRGIIKGFGWPVPLIAALIAHESGGQSHILSVVGAVGLMQVMPCDCREELRYYFASRPSTAALRCPYVNVAFGCNILRNKSNSLGGNLSTALAGYYGGISSTGQPTQDGLRYAKNVLALNPRFADLA